MKTLPPLASLIAGIKASATPATHKIVSESPAPLSVVAGIKATVGSPNLLKTILAERNAAPTHSGITTPASQEVENLLRACREMEKELALAGQARKEREALVEALTVSNASLVARLEALTRELAEARNDRKAEARTLANVFALHFLGPQGTGTADRIKAVGGSWKFHRAAVKDQFAASGFWLMPDTCETNALCADLQAEGKSIRTCPV